MNKNLLFFAPKKIMGNYINSNLIKDEQLIYDTKHHWVYIFNPVTIILSLFFFFIPLIFKLINYYTNEFGITTKRVIIKTGFIRRDTLEINISKIESVIVNQSVLGRILGFGSIAIVGTGGTKSTYPLIKDPKKFRSEFQGASL